MALPPVGSNLPNAASGLPSAAGFTNDGADGVGSLAPEHGLGVWPWILAAIALAAGAIFLFWKRNSREAYAGAPHFDHFVAPQPAPSPPVRKPPPPRAAVPPPPAPAPQPSQPTPAPVATGIVSTRLRPSIELDLKPLRCIIDDQQVVFELEIALSNTGTAHARDVLIEATMFNASPEQDREIAAYFANPIGQGERIAAIEPLGRLALLPQLSVAKDRLRLLDAGGRKVFVPLIAVNILYGGSGGDRQTSAAYLVGRDTGAEKLAPFRADLGARVFRSLGARLLNHVARN